MSGFSNALRAAPWWFRDAVLLAVAELELDTLLSRATTAGEVARTKGWHPRRLGALCRAGARAGALQALPGGKWRSSGQGGPVLVAADRSALGDWGRLAEAVRTGRWQDPSAWLLEHQTSMAGHHATEAAGLAELWSALTPAPELLLDLGCGLGTFSRALLQRWPEARALRVDLPEVIALQAPEPRVTTVAADARHLQADRVRAWAGTAPDAAVCAHLIHHLSDEDLRLMLGGLRQILIPGAQLALVEVAHDPQGAGTDVALYFDLQLILTTAAGRVRSVPQLKRHARRAGLLVGGWRWLDRPAAVGVLLCTAPGP